MPVTARVPAVSIFPLEPVVVAYPLTNKFRVKEMPVDEAYTIVVKPVKVLAPVTERVPPVLILVLIVVAAPTETAIKRVEKTSDRANVRPMPPFLVKENRCIRSWLLLIFNERPFCSKERRCFFTSKSRASHRIIHCRLTASCG